MAALHQAGAGRTSVEQGDDRPIMPHDAPLIATIAAGLGLAFVFGAIASRLRVPPLVGYLVAGILVGPHTPGFVADQELASQLAEIGVILLMFGVGLHFSLKDLLSVRAIAIPGASAQIAVATLLGAGLAWLLGWSMGAGVMFGLALSTASTVVLLRALQERRLLETERGRIAVGWLIVEDIAMVIALVLVPAFAAALGGNVGETGDVLPAPPPDLTTLLLYTVVKFIAFVAFMLIVGRRVIPFVLHYVAHTGSRELFRLAVLAIALGVAVGAALLFGVSVALGAFFAGMILSESELSHRAAEESLPLRDAFAVLFFVSVGMLFDPRLLIEHPLPIIATLFIIVFGKSLAAFLIVVAFGHPLATALTISASLAQIGEFSFILAQLGVSLNLLPTLGRDLILAGAILSILLNPFSFAAIDWLKPKLEKSESALAALGVRTKAPDEEGEKAEAASEREGQAMSAQHAHTVIIGYGRVGSLVGKSLLATHQPFLVIEDADKIIAGLRAQGIETIFGNASKPQILKAANLPSAQHLVIAIPNAFEAGRVVEQARAASPALHIIARAHSDAEAEYLTKLGANAVVMGEREIARGMIDLLSSRSA